MRRHSLRLQFLQMSPIREYRLTPMPQNTFKVGDTIRVTGYRPGVYAPGVKDELGTEELFKSLVGNCYIVKGFNEHGHIELEPTWHDTVWIEPDLVELAVEDSEG